MTLSDPIGGAAPTEDDDTLPLAARSFESVSNATSLLQRSVIGCGVAGTRACCVGVLMFPFCLGQDVNQVCTVMLPLLFVVSRIDVELHKSTLLLITRHIINNLPVDFSSTPITRPEVTVQICQHSIQAPFRNS